MKGEEELTEDARNTGGRGSGERRLERGRARGVERAKGDGARADAADDG